MSMYGDVILVRFVTPSQFESRVEHDKQILRVSKWLKENVAGPTEWGYVNGHRVGVFLKPEDATMFRLTFDLKKK